MQHCCHQVQAISMLKTHAQHARGAQADMMNTREKSMTQNHKTPGRYHVTILWLSVMSGGGNQERIQEPSSTLPSPKEKKKRQGYYPEWHAVRCPASVLNTGLYTQQTACVCLPCGSSSRVANQGFSVVPSAPTIVNPTGCSIPEKESRSRVLLRGAVLASLLQSLVQLKALYRVPES